MIQTSRHETTDRPPQLRCHYRSRPDQSVIYDQRNSLNLDAEGQYLVYRYHRNFVRAGAQLLDADKETLKALNKEESTLSTQFRQRILADTAGSAVVVDKKTDLAGMSESDIAAA